MKRLLEDLIRAVIATVTETSLSGAMGLQHSLNARIATEPEEE